MFATIYLIGLLTTLFVIMAWNTPETDIDWYGDDDGMYEDKDDNYFG